MTIVIVQIFNYLIQDIKLSPCCIVYNGHCRLRMDRNHCYMLSTYMVGDMQYSYKSLNKLMFSHILSCLILKTALVFSADIFYIPNKTIKQTNKKNTTHRDVTKWRKFHLSEHLSG